MSLRLKIIKVRTREPIALNCICSFGVNFTIKSVITTHRVLFDNTGGSADLRQLSVKFITV